MHAFMCQSSLGGKTHDAAAPLQTLVWTKVDFNKPSKIVRAHAFDVSDDVHRARSGTWKKFRRLDKIGAPRIGRGTCMKKNMALEQVMQTPAGNLQSREEAFWADRLSPFQMRQQPIWLDTMVYHLHTGASNTK